MPNCESVPPRTMLPPPTTMATWAPTLEASRTWLAMERASAMSMPWPSSLQNASPLIFRRTRLYRALAIECLCGSMPDSRCRMPAAESPNPSPGFNSDPLLTEFDSHELAHDDVLAGLAHPVLHVLAVGPLEDVFLGVRHAHEADLGV